MPNKLEIIAFAFFSLFMLVVAERAVNNWGETRAANARV